MENSLYTWQEILHDVWWYYNLCPDNPPDPRGFVGQAAGGNLHNVLDDGNWERKHVIWSTRAARDGGDKAGFILGLKLLAMSNMQVARLVLNKYHLYCYGAVEPK